uniref:Uncharacterized protein n=1 Tax=Arundo donax TaxID=35708 RepID=A0A0A9FUY4_ARUDO
MSSFIRIYLKHNPGPKIVRNRISILIVLASWTLNIFTLNHLHQNFCSHTRSIRF